MSTLTKQAFDDLVLELAGKVERRCQVDLDKGIRANVSYAKPRLPHPHACRVTFLLRPADKKARPSLLFSTIVHEKHLAQCKALCSGWFGNINQTYKEVA